MKLSWKTSSRGLFACGLLCIAAALAGCSLPVNEPVFSDTPPPPAVDSPSNVARFHVGDTVTVTLTGLPEIIEPHSEPIKEDGTITMPNIGHVPAAGKTAGELQNEIYDLYVPTVYRHVTVTVNTGDRVYYVTGEVKQPGRQLYAGQMTVTKAITTAGDFTDFANHKKVWLIRASGQRIRVNCDKAIQDASQDPLVYPNDQVQVPRRIW
jgi:polysaccharide export outer membrane protein